MITEIIEGSFDPGAPKIKMIMQGDSNSRKKNKPNPPEDSLAPAPWPEVQPGESVDEDAKAILLDRAGESIAEGIQQQSAPNPQADQVNVVELSDSDSSSSSGSSDLDDDDIPDSRFDDDTIEAIGLEPKVQEVHIAGFETFQHNKSGTVHYRDPSFSSRLLCNRIYTGVYSKIKGQLKYQWSICSQCIAKTQRP
jgi:hypothetical protein